MTIPFEQINSVALLQLPALLQEWFPRGQRRGKEYLIGDLTGAAGKSLSINLNTCQWADFATGQAGGDPISLAAAAFHGDDRVKAAKALGRRFGLYFNGSSAASAPRMNLDSIRAPKPKSDPVFTPAPPPPDAPPPPLDGASHLYIYRDTAGTPVRYIRRYDATSYRPKYFTPATWGELNGVTGWHKKHAPKPHILYGLDRLAAAPNATVIVTEGEKSADAAQALYPAMACVTWSGGTGNVTSADWTPLTGRSVIIWPDNDPNGIKAAAKLTSALASVASKIQTLHVEDLNAKDDAADVNPKNPTEWINDRLINVEIKSKVDKLEDIKFNKSTLDHDLKRIYITLDQNDKGVIYPTVHNALLLLDKDSRVNTCIAYDDFKSEACLLSPPPQMNDIPMPGPYPRTWTGEDVTYFHAFMQREWCPKFTRQTVEDAMLAAATQRRFHPVREWLAGLQWDGMPRLDDWITKAFGVPADAYHEAIGAKVLIAAVRRVHQPGCQFKHMLILEGFQNMGKSAAIKTLFSEKWFSDHLPAALESRDAAIGLQGVWCLEWAEIEKIIRTDVEIVKGFLSRTIDRFRPVYGKNYVEKPRQGIMIGTTNASDYLRDETGNIRFWPVACKKVDVEWIASNREQLWAEAACRESEGEAIWLDDSQVVIQAAKHQEDRLEEDVWGNVVSVFIRHLSCVTTAEILTDCLKIPIERQTKREQMRAAKILTRHGWKRHVSKDEITRESIRVWKPPPLN
jgi:predicted P-loop ATPase